MHQIKFSTLRKLLSICAAPLVVSLCLQIQSVSAQGTQIVTPGVNRPIKDKWAVIIGISKFANGNVPELQYPSKDAQDLYDFLTGEGNFAKDHVLLLKDADATKVRIMDAFGDGWLPRRVMKDDLVLIFISSHGSPADEAGENFIIAYDSDPDHTYATGIRFQDLSNEVTKRTGCDRLVLLLDACHSGAAVVGRKSLVRTKSNFNLDTITGTGQLVISSSKPDQVSWESKRYPNGVFTRKLIEAMRTQGKSGKVGEVYQSLKKGVEQEVQFDRVASQTPMMLSKWTGQDLSLCAQPAEPRAVLSELGGSQLISQPQSSSSAGTGTTAATGTTATTIPMTVASNLPPIRKLPPSLSPENPNSPFHNLINSLPPMMPFQKMPPVAPARPASPPLLSTAMMVSTWTDNGGDVTLEQGTNKIFASDLRGLTQQQLLLLYNEAYARHGRGFMRKDIQDYFSSQPWYRRDPDYHWHQNDPKVIARHGMNDDSLVINAKRTPQQWANMQLIKSFFHK